MNLLTLPTKMALQAQETALPELAWQVVLEYILMEAGICIDDPRFFGLYIIRELEQIQYITPTCILQHQRVQLSS